MTKVKTTEGDVTPENWKEKVTEANVKQHTEPKKKQAKSVSYALKAMANHVVTIHEDGLLSDEELQEARKILEKATTKYIKREYGIE